MISIYLSQFLNEEHKEVIIKGSNKRFRDFCYIDDVVNITIQSINDENFKNEIINVGTGIKTAVDEIIFHIQNISSIKKPISIKENTPGDQYGIYADVSKLKKLIDFEVTKLDKGLEKMINWAKLNNKKS